MSIALIELPSPSAGPAEIPRRGVAVTLGQAVSAVVAAKSVAGCRPAYVRSLRQYLTMFAKGREGWPLAAITTESVEEWFAGRSEAPTARVANTGRLAALFSYAVRRKWTADNPTRYLERIRIDRKPPFALTPLQAALILDWCRRRKPNQIPFFALAMLAGVRPDEIERLTWKAVNLDDGTLTIDAAASKVRLRRVVDLEPVALEWLKWAKERGGRLPVKRMTRRRYLAQASRLLDFKTWPQDCLRHTAASYLLAKHKNAGFVAYQLGNSQRILETHYRALVTEKDCAAFWSFTPESPRPPKPLPLPRPAPVLPEFAPVQLPLTWGIAIDPEWPRFARAEAALAAEPLLRKLARQRQSIGAYHGGVFSTRMKGERIDTLLELGKIAGCSRQTLQYVRVIVRSADPDVLDKLRVGKLTIAGTYKRICQQ